MEPCPICGVVVSRKGDIKRHIAIHTPGPKFVFYLWLACYTRLDAIFFFWSLENFTVHGRTVRTVPTCNII